jgi:hypothetical protein
MIELFQVMVWATQLGFPLDNPFNIPLNPFDPRVNMNGWIWSTASSSQIVARISWNVR